MFPVEIWENILHKVDANPLLHLRTVNKTWDEIITKHLEKSDAWYRQCEKDVPKKYWNLMLDNSFHSVKLKRQQENNEEHNRYDSKIWRTLYKAWRKWINVNWYGKCTTEEFSPIPKHRESERITCCSTLGELVAIGSSEGYIRVYNLRTNNIVFYVDQYECATSVKLWVQGKNYDKIILIATSHNKKVRVWDINEQKLLRNRRTGFAICAGHSYYCIGLQRGIILVHNLATGENFSVTMVIEGYDVLDEYMLEYIPEDIYPINMTLNMDKLSCLFNDGNIYEIDFKETGEETVLYQPESTHLGGSKHQKIVTYYLFNPSVAFCITDRSQLGISVDKSKWVFHNTFSFLEGSVTAIHYHVSLLAIGLDYGCVCLYSVKDPMGLKKIDFKSARKIQVATGPIVSINIMEFAEDQRLIVTSAHSVYNIKLGYE